MMEASRLAESLRAEYGEEEMANRVRAVGGSPGGSPLDSAAAAAACALVDGASPVVAGHSSSVKMCRTGNMHALAGTVHLDISTKQAFRNLRTNRICACDRWRSDMIPVLLSGSITEAEDFVNVPLRSYGAPQRANEHHSDVLQLPGIGHC